MQVSALAYPELTTQIPHAVDIALPRGAEKPRIEYPPVSVHWFSGPAFTSGIETPTVDGQKLRVYSAEKSIADAFKYLANAVQEPASGSRVALMMVTCVDEAGRCLSGVERSSAKADCGAVCLLRGARGNLRSPPNSSSGQRRKVGGASRKPRELR